MNKDDIKKALRCCADIGDCDDCPYDAVRSCSDRLKLDARELITEQEKEIERLKDEDTRLTEKLKQVLLAVDTVKEMNTMCNIERLNDDYSKLQEQFAQYQIASDKEIIAQKKQAVKEFAEKIKRESENFLIGYGDGQYDEHKYISVEYIDELLKEYE